MKLDDFLTDLSKRECCIALLVNNNSAQAVEYIKCWGECDLRTAIDTVRMLKTTDEYHTKLSEKKEKREQEKQEKIQKLRSRSLFGDSDTGIPAERTHLSHTGNVQKKPTKQYLYLIDGDNHVYEAIEGIVSKADNNDRIRVFVSQIGLHNKLVEKDFPYTEIIYVESSEKGDQAVDNRIKAELGNAVKSKKYARLFVISQDKGYRALLEKYREQYGYTEKELDVRDVF